LHSSVIWRNQLPSYPILEPPDGYANAARIGWLALCTDQGNAAEVNIDLAGPGVPRASSLGLILLFCTTPGPDVVLLSARVGRQPGSHILSMLKIAANVT
jgi:hypothetical protein